MEQIGLEKLLEEALQRRGWERPSQTPQEYWAETIKDLEAKAESLGRKNPWIEPLKKQLKEEGLL